MVINDFDERLNDPDQSDTDDEMDPVGSKGGQAQSPDDLPLTDNTPANDPYDDTIDDFDD